jgi:ribosomal protein L11 methyltransferase
MTSGKGRRLFVYECSAPGLPASEPVEPSFVGIWPEPPYYYLFFDNSVDQTVAEWVQVQKGWELKGRYEIDYDQWQQVSTEAQTIGSFVVASYEWSPSTYPSSGGRLLRIDPGVVFGSGLHPTTRGCLLALDHLFARFPIRSVVDFGTGTGILAIACGLLGASRVVALDCNLLAVRVARRNFVANGVENTAHLVVADDPGVLQVSCDLIVMNIEWPCLKQIVPGSGWQHHGLFVLSGFMESQWRELSVLLPPSFAAIHEESHDGWLTVVLKSHSFEKR